MLPQEAFVEVISAEYLDGYRLAIGFSDGHVQDVDFEPFLRRSLHPEISKYLNLDLFKQFRIVDGQLDWFQSTPPPREATYDLCFPLSDLYEGTI